MVFISLEMDESFIKSKENNWPTVKVWGTLETFIFAKMA